MMSQTVTRSHGWPTKGLVYLHLPPWLPQMKKTLAFENLLWEDFWETKFANKLGPIPSEIPVRKKVHLLFSFSTANQT